RPDCSAPPCWELASPFASSRSMTSPNSSTSSSERSRSVVANPGRALVALFTAAFVVVAGATAFSYAGLRCEISRLANVKLLRYQKQKLARSHAALVLVGDSSLGNAIDAELLSQLSGKPTINLALTGSHGFEGAYNMLRRAFRQGTP